MPSDDKVVQTYQRSVKVISDFLRESAHERSLPEWVIKHNASALIARLAEENLLIEDVEELEKIPT